MNQPLTPSAETCDVSTRIRTQEKIAVFLALVAGYTDSTGLIRWKTYVSFMSGNTTQLGTALSNHTSGIIITSGTVIICFVFGIYTGTCLSLQKKSRNTALRFYIVSALLILYTIISYFYMMNAVSSIAVIGFSMGIMNTIVTSVGSQKVNTDFVTGTLNSLAINTALLTMTKDKAEKKEYTSHTVHLLLVWFGFLSGAFAAPFLLPVLGDWSLILPATALLTCGLLISILNIKL
jgi:uncharacterized membrane protein YoaK (UPF0700 family)